MIDTLNRTARHTAKKTHDILTRAMAAAGWAESPAKLARDAQEYWRSAGDERWKSRSHWRDATVFADNDLWTVTGKRHLELFDRLSRVCDRPARTATTLEWGCGGGANAVAFAPRSERFIGVEISEQSLEECRRQVEATCDASFVPVLIDGDRPENVLDEIEPGSVDLFVSFYVFELITSQEYGARLLRIARELLADDGLALIQIKYDIGSFRTGPRRRGYRRGMEDMTTYRIDAFWALTEACGLRPELVHLVPENELDGRYAYFLLSRRT